MLSALLMFRRFGHAVSRASRDEGFHGVAAVGVLLLAIGTLTYSTSQGWDPVDAFYFSAATLTTSSVADPELVIRGTWIKVFTIFYLLVGIGILVELLRQLGFAYIALRDEERIEKRAAKQPAADPVEAGGVGDV